MKKVSVLLLCVLTAFAACVFVPPASEVDASQKSAKNLAVVMYHNTVPDNYKASVYVIRAGSLERDLKFLKENGLSCSQRFRRHRQSQKRYCSARKKRYVDL